MRNRIGIWIRAFNGEPAVPGEEGDKETLEILEVVFGPVAGTRQIMAKLLSKVYPPIATVAQTRYAALARLFHKLGDFFAELDDRAKRNIKID